MKTKTSDDINTIAQKLVVLAIDDDPTQIELLREISNSLEYPEIEYLSAYTVKEGLEAVKTNTIDLVLTDYQLPDGNGLFVLNQIKEWNPVINVIIMTAYESTQNAVELLKLGADDYLVKPTRAADIRRIYTVTYERLEYVRETGKIKKQIEEAFDTHDIAFNSKVMLEVLHTAVRSAKSDATVLLTGESGTGKELIARHIHDTSYRASGPFTAINISALPESLVESELFGHKKGSFTGATEERVGMFEGTHGGTVFIDEIGDLSLLLQVKLLRVLQFGEVQRVGDNKPVKLDVRIIAATNKNITQMVKEKTFREDFYYRLNVITIDVPPLRRRKGDIPVLIEFFIQKFNKKNNRQIKGISREALEHIMTQPLPGNVRELENMIERAVVLSQGSIIQVRDLPQTSVDAFYLDMGLGASETYKSKMEAIETVFINNVLQECGGNQSKAARSLGITERHLRSRMEKLNINNTWR